MSKVKLPFNILTIAESKNFSEYGEDFERGDDGEGEDLLLSKLNADFMLIDVLMHLNDREKIIFMYELLKESGYGLSGEVCARTLSISRTTYIKGLKKVRAKAKKTLQEVSS